MHSVCGTPQLAKAPLMGEMNWKSRTWPRSATSCFHRASIMRLRQEGSAAQRVVRGRDDEEAVSCAPGVQ